MRTKAKQYNRLKIFSSVVELVISMLYIIVFLITGLSGASARVAQDVFHNPYLSMLLFTGMVSVGGMVLNFPLDFYSRYCLEHKYSLSNQSLGRWIWEEGKSKLIGSAISIPLLLTFYYCLRRFESHWWLPVAGVLFLFSVVLSRVAPVLIFPLFYKFIPIQEGELKRRLLALGQKAGIRIAGIFTFNLSKNTKKANAALTGIGKSKRIILGDTLIDSFTEDEILSVFAHEVGHIAHGHLWKGILWGTASSFLGLYSVSLCYGWSIGVFGYENVTQIAALPLLAIWLTLYSLITMPAGNGLSRWFERQADAYALSRITDRVVYIAAMRKLEEQNLADPDPHPLIEFFFYSHPSISKRIRFAEEYAA